MRSPTTEEILAKCPEIIHKADIPDHNVGGRPREGGGSRVAVYYTEEDRIRAASVYATTGKCNAAKTSVIVNIPAETLRVWRAQEWWPQVIDRIRQEKDDEHDQAFTEIIDNILPEISDRIAAGDYILNHVTGKLVRKPMGGKELGILTSIVADKRDLMRRKQKSQTETASTTELLKQIAKTVKEFVSQNNQKTIEGEVIHAEKTNAVAEAHQA